MGPAFQPLSRLCPSPGKPSLLRSSQSPLSFRSSPCSCPLLWPPPPTPIPHALQPASTWHMPVTATHAKCQLPEVTHPTCTGCNTRQGMQMFMNRSSECQVQGLQDAGQRPKSTIRFPQISLWTKTNQEISLSTSLSTSMLWACVSG